MKAKIHQFVWFETQAKEAADWYVEIFGDSRITEDFVLSGTPMGEARFINLELAGRKFQFASVGKLFERNPSFSYIVACPEIGEAENLWQSLSQGAEILMPFGEYSFCQKYGWLKDRFGLSWQIMHDGSADLQKITPALMFTGDVCGKAEEAMNFYSSVFESSGLMEGHLSRYRADQAPNREGTLNYARFRLEDLEFVVMDSAAGHDFGFNEMQTFLVRCADQDEMNRFWEKLSAVPESEQCGWLKDRFGVSWQLVPEFMDGMMSGATREQKEKLVQTFLPMKKLDFSSLQKACYDPLEEITVETRIDASIERVWELWTSPNHIKKWNFASPDWCCPDAENNLMKGGRFRYRMSSVEGSEAFDFEGVYNEVQEFRKIKFTLSDGRRVRVRFKITGNSVCVTETFDPENIHPARLQKEGWQSILNNFKHYAEIA